MKKKNWECSVCAKVFLPQKHTRSYTHRHTHTPKCNRIKGVPMPVIIMIIMMNRFMLSREPLSTAMTVYTCFYHCFISHQISNISKIISSKQLFLLRKIFFRKEIESVDSLQSLPW